MSNPNRDEAPAADPRDEKHPEDSSLLIDLREVERRMWETAGETDGDFDSYGE